ncbi:uncharacterized protein LOC26529607 isoform X1 [Drosophila willistoni]|uniref:uncharacterized protein LOC26529607 isoform X1 n=1 Tax=Drosophila willistoni TaxID=7260 RepID=UPI000C26C302|nr:uncharacterized protein LOC26529607 isoform X1 [Drosophila willistoni]
MSQQRHTQSRLVKKGTTSVYKQMREYMQNALSVAKSKTTSTTAHGCDGAMRQGPMSPETTTTTLKTNQDRKAAVACNLKCYSLGPCAI